MTCLEEKRTNEGWKCGNGGDYRRSSILGFLQRFRFVASFANRVPLGFLSRQKVQLRLHFPLIGEQQPSDQLPANFVFNLNPLTDFSLRPTVSSNSSSSFLATKGHQPLILFCLKMDTMGISASLVTISRVHCLAVLAPRGKRFRSSSIAPEKKVYLTMIKT